MEIILKNKANIIPRVKWVGILQNLPYLMNDFRIYIYIYIYNFPAFFIVNWILDCIWKVRDYFDSMVIKHFWDHVYDWFVTQYLDCNKDMSMKHSIISKNEFMDIKEIWNEEIKIIVLSDII